MPLDLQYDLVNLTPADAAPPEANFNRIEQYVNTELIDRAGTTAMTGQLKLIGDPVAPLDAVPKQYVDAFVPVGTIMMYGGDVAPPGGKWALCNGADLEAALYPTLYNLIGNRYGGSGGHFNLPDLAGRFPIGVSSSDTLGATGGSRDAPIVTHTHPIDHTHAAGTTGNDAPDHGHHTLGHNHGVNINSGTESAGHNHFLQYGEVMRLRRDLSFPNADNVTTFAVRVGDGITIIQEAVQSTNVNAIGTENQAHAHNTNGVTTTNAPDTLGAATQHQHPFQTPTHSGSSGAPAGAVAVGNANLPPYLAVSYIMRVA